MTERRQGPGEGPEDRERAGRRRDAAGTDPRPSGGRRGRAARPVDPGRPCMNCGDPTPGEFCPTCGQRKVDVRVSVRTLVMDVLEDQFLLDRRLPHTLKALFFRPGFLTVEHVNGRIVRYIHPFRLYLVTSLLFFLLLSFTSLRLVRRAMDDDGVSLVRDSTDTVALDSAIAAIDSVLADTAGGEDVVAAAELSSGLARLRRQRRAARLDSLGSEAARLDSTLAQLEESMADSSLATPLRASLEATRSGVVTRRAVIAAQRDSIMADSAALTGGPGRATTTVGSALGWDDEMPTLSVGIAVVDSAVMGQLRRLAAMEPREAMETLVGTFFNYVPTMMFILLPLFAAVLKLLYIRRRRYYAEHFVFLLHVHSFVFLLATAMLLLRRWAAGWIEAALFLWILVYIFIALKRVYGQGWLKTFVKYWILGWAYFWILVFVFPVAIVLTLLLF